MKPESAELKDTRISRDNWKNKALKRQAALDKSRVKGRDIEKSRNNWKDKALDVQKNIKELQKELEDTPKKLTKAENINNRKKNSTQ